LNPTLQVREQGERGREGEAGSGFRYTVGDLMNNDMFLTEADLNPTLQVKGCKEREG
jgi:hypothetical protein